MPELPLPVMSAGISCLLDRDHRLGLDLDLPGRVEQRRDDAGRGGPRLAEDLAVRARHVRPVRAIGDEHPRAHDVVDRRAGALERLGDDREAEPRLLVGALGRRRAVRRDRRGAGDVHGRAHDDRPREAGDGFERRVARDEAALHCPGSIARALEALHLIDGWDVPFAAAGVTRADGTIATRGDTRRAVPLASVSKPVSALATLVAAEEGVVDLDEPAGPPGSTVRHLLAHASGLPFEGAVPIAPPGRRRIYSNEGFAVLGEHVAARAEMPFADYVRAAVCEPLGHRARSVRACRQRHARLPRRRARARARAARPAPRRAETHDEMVAVQFPGSTACCPTSAASARSTGASASS